MVGPLRRHWAHFRQSRPGRRFQDFYDRKRGSRGGALWRCGAVPGHGIPILALGTVLIAQQSQVTARLLDRAEMSLRRFVRNRGRG
jgi:hypothetical protein